MAKKIKLVTSLIIVAVIIAAGVSIFIVNGKSIDCVKDTAMSASTNSSFSIGWHEVSNADGYHIYYLNGETNKYEKLADVEGSDNCTYEIAELEGGTVYTLKVSAYRFFMNKEYESESTEPIVVYSLPDKVSTKVSSVEEGVLNVSWQEQKNVIAYELEYSKNEDFSDAGKCTFKKAELKKCEHIVKDLKPKDVYFVRMRSYITINNENVYGSWSDVQKVEIKDKITMGANIDPKKPIVALSFDDGPGFGDGKNKSTTMQILDVLEKYGARATFFMCGSRLSESNKAVLQREIKLGCELGNHTYDHSHYGKNVTAADISKNSNKIKKLCGQAPTMFRCPGGMMSSTIQVECKAEGMPIAYWSVDTEDWKSKDAKSVYKIATTQVYDGSIILMHDIYPSTVEAVKKIVPKLIEDGYQIVTVSEMLTIKNGGKAPKPGNQYIDYETINNKT